MLARMWSNRKSHSFLVEMQNGTATWEDSFAVSHKTKHTLTLQSSNDILGNHPQKLKTYVRTQTYTRMFIAALFIIAKTWKQQACSTVDEVINKLWHIH